jgi:hypothetical protein
MPHQAADQKASRPVAMLLALAIMALFWAPTIAGPAHADPLPLNLAPGSVPVVM